MRPLLRNARKPFVSISEPDVGSNVAEVKTRADKKGDRYVLNGSKLWVTNGMFADFGGGKKGQMPNFEERMAFMKEKNQFYQQEGVAAILVDAKKHHGLLFTTGGWSGMERPSATRKIAQVAVAHEHYGLLYRLASRGEPASSPVSSDSLVAQTASGG